jgi:hypothetical protein
MRSLLLAIVVAVVPSVAHAQSRAVALVADSVVTPSTPPADMRGLVPGQRVHVRAFLGDCRRSLAVYGTVAGWAGDTMTVNLEPRGTTLAGEQLAVPIATILQLHVSMGKSGRREKWVEVKRPSDVKHERSCPATLPPPIPGMSRPGIPPA